MKLITNILAIETTTQICSVALKINNRLFEKVSVFYKNNNDYILSMIDEILKENKNKLNNIHLIAFGCGPGSFTGMRTGLNIASSLSLGCNIPIVGIPTMIILAEAVWRLRKVKQVISFVSVSMKRFYWSAYIRISEGFWRCLRKDFFTNHKYFIKSVSTLKGSWVVVGNFNKEIFKICNNFKDKVRVLDILFPRAKDILPVANFFYNTGNTYAPLNLNKLNYVIKESHWDKNF